VIAVATLGTGIFAELVDPPQVTFRLQESLAL
jgi:hypothetical protein